MSIRGSIGALFITIGLLIGGCSVFKMMPTNTRTGKVYDILITEAGIEPRDPVIGMGDEVRFRNERTKPSYVFFFRDFIDELSCQRGFTLFWGTEEEAKIPPGESASLCFNRPGTVGYKVQFETTDFGGIGGSPGEITIPTGYHGAIIVK